MIQDGETITNNAIGTTKNIHAFATFYLANDFFFLRGCCQAFVNQLIAFLDCTAPLITSLEMTSNERVERRCHPTPKRKRHT
mmetsp:Transcript_43832/g.74832  ORF Transcript_43832/g.74832 Transcript_43832/m.74832 type:complete len:82 (+) Transcript_43832:927-1172(+)